MYIIVIMSPEELFVKYTDATNEIKVLRDENQHLKDRIAWFEKQIFEQKQSGIFPTMNSKSCHYRFQNRTLKSLRNNYYTRNKDKHTPQRDEIPAHLPRVDKNIDPDFDTSGYVKIAEKVTEELHYKPAEFYVLRLIRPVFKRIADNGEIVIFTPELPPRCIDKGIAGSSLVAQLLVTKCVDHNPLYRFQEQVRRYCDYDIPYSTISGWFSKGAFWLSSLVPALQSRILKVVISRSTNQP